MIKFFLTIGGVTSVNRMLGVAREVLMSYFLGTSVVMESFIVAIKIPGLFRRVFSEGALNSAFIPQFAKEYKENGREQAEYFASQVVSICFITLLILLTIFEFYTPSIMYLLAPGFAKDPERFTLVVEYSRIVFPFIMFVVLSGILSGVLNSFEKFFVASAAPAIINVLTASSLLFYNSYSNYIGIALCLAVTLSGVIQYAWLYSACLNNNIRLRLVLPKFSGRVKKLFLLIGPGLIAASSTQLNVVVDLIFASFLPRGAIAYLHYADRLNHIPLSIIGTAVGTAILPMLSKTVTDEHATFKKQNEAVCLLSNFIFPFAFILVILKAPLVKLMYGHGQFSAQAVLETSQTVAAFSIGLPAYVLGKVMAASFFAREDTVTPLKTALVSISINIVLNFILINHLVHVGMALSTSIAGWCNVFIMYFVLLKRRWIHLTFESILSIIYVLGACVLMAMALWFVQTITPVESSSTLWEAVSVISTLIFGVSIYTFCLLLKKKVFSSSIITKRIINAHR